VAPAKKVSAKKAPGTRAAASARPVKKRAARKPAAAPAAAHPKPTDKQKATVSSQPNHHPEIPAPRGVSKDGVAYTKDFDVKFLKAQRQMLHEERARLLGQAVRLEDEAHALIEEAEMGDVQFDDEGGEGDTMVVERERDLALSAQARETIEDIDDALERIGIGTYGYSVKSGLPIPRERLEAIPWATELVREKVGGIGRR
jgi:RNA polymerase-binding transcription factor DksA